jgi:aerobic carbon-monoxide dehydrogenase medium subunit
VTALSYIRAAGVDEAVRLVADDPWGTKIVAGGTALVLMMRQGLIAPERLVAIGGIPGLDDITENHNHVSIGACTTLDQVSRSKLVRERLPSLAEACAVAANLRVRNVATLGGNLAEADYASDPPATLLSLDAHCEVTGTKGSRLVTVADLMTGLYTTCLEPGEIITRILVPVPEPGSWSAYIKYRTRSSEDRACVGVAVFVTESADRTVSSLSVAVGAVAPIPQYFPDVCRAATGQRLNAGLAKEIADAYASRIEPIDDLRGSSWYRSQLIRVLVRRALLQTRSR